MKEDVYRRVRDTIISWAHPDTNVELALSFQEAAGCEILWDLVCQAQGLHGADGAAGSSPGTCTPRCLSAIAFLPRHLTGCIRWGGVCMCVCVYVWLCVARLLQPATNIWLTRRCSPLRLRCMSSCPLRAPQPWTLYWRSSTIPANTRLKPSPRLCLTTCVCRRVPIPGLGVLTRCAHHRMVPFCATSWTCLMTWSF